MIVLLVAPLLMLEVAMASGASSLAHFLRSQRANKVLILLAPEKFSLAQVEKMSVGQKAAAFQKLLHNPSHANKNLEEKIMGLAKSDNPKIRALFSPRKESIREFMTSPKESFQPMTPEKNPVREPSMARRSTPEEPTTWVGGNADGRLEKIMSWIELSIKRGDVEAFRERMVQLLDVPFAQIQQMGLGNVLSKETVGMMYKHPDENTRHPFRLELYDFVNRLGGMPETIYDLHEPYEFLNAFASKRFFVLPVNHKSIYDVHIPKLAFHETELGLFAVEDGVTGLVQGWEALVETASFGEILAYYNAGIAGMYSHPSMIDAAINVNAGDLLKLNDFHRANHALLGKITRNIDMVVKEVPSYVGWYSSAGGLVVSIYGGFLLGVGGMGGPTTLAAAASLIVGIPVGLNLALRMWLNREIGAEWRTQ